MTTDTVIFDMDGTLLDTLDDLTDSVNHALECYKLPKRNRMDIRQFLGNGAEVLMRLAIDERLSEDDILKCISEFKSYYKEHMDCKTKPYEGVMELIRELISKGYSIAIVSNKFDAAVKGLNIDYFEGLFPVAIGESEGISKKPAPDVVYKALDELHKDKEHAIYVGDSEVDIMTARNSGLPVVSVTWGFRDEDYLREMNADYIINEPMQLLDVLAGRNHN